MAQTDSAPSRRARLKRLIAAIAIVVVGRTQPACASARVWEEEAFDRSVPIGELAAVRISNTNGAVRVTGEAGARAISIRATKRAGASTADQARAALADVAITITPHDGTLEVRSEYPSGGNSVSYQVNYEISVPPSFTVEAVTVNGAVDARAVAAADLESTNGAVSASGVNTVTASTMNGAVDVDSASGPLRLRTTNGSVRARMVPPIREVSIETTNGRVSLEIADGANADLDVSVVNGSTRLEGIALRDSRQDWHRLRGTIGEGGTPIRIATVNGEVTVRRGR